jgi:hypothetical protein
MSAYHHYSCEFEPVHGEVYSIQLYVIKFVSDLWLVGGFLLVFWVTFRRCICYHTAMCHIMLFDKMMSCHVTVWSEIWFRFMVFNVTFKNISVTLRVHVEWKKKQKKIFRTRTRSWYIVYKKKVQQKVNVKTLKLHKTKVEGLNKFNVHMMGC